MTAEQPATKKCIVKFSCDERNQLNMLIQKGKCPARQALNAWIQLKADVSPAEASFKATCAFRAVSR